MKKLFLSLVALVVATLSYAQGSLLATLSHDGQISAFYGANALKQAMAAAESGDVITLSSGQFNAVNITKPITLRGAGMSVNTDSINPHEATILQGAFSINIADSLSGRVIMEGLYSNSNVTYTGVLKNAQFQKCRFLNFIAGTGASITNSSFIHCRIYNGFKQNENSNVFFINSIVCAPRSESMSSSIEFDNCFVKYDYNSNYGIYVYQVVNAYYKNCVIQATYYGGNSTIPSSCVAYNCVSVGNYSGIFNNMTSKNTTNKYLSSPTGFFKTYTATGHGTYINDSWSFEPTESAAKTYLGTDGTQVGIYGGNLPYDEDPTIPQITKCNVASKSTADGKLSVDIEVKAAEY